jgi:peroxiredoxin Q/BCP
MKRFFGAIFIFLVGGWGLVFPSIGSADVKVGEKAPEFSAVDDAGLNVSLKDYRGKTVILYFYPKDDTPGCTAEAQNFRDSVKEFEAKNAIILGVSYDTISSHQQFKEKYQLPFRLLVDADHKIAAAYGAEGSAHASRDTIVIDSKGKIVKIFRAVDPHSHVPDVLKSLP